MFERQMAVIQHRSYERPDTHFGSEPCLEIVFRDFSRECSDFVVNTSDTTLADLFPMGSKVSITLTPVKK